jgi:uncharacterized protein YcbK (DUF882 family)
MSPIRITAIRDTYLKKFDRNAEDLNEFEKVEVKEGKSYTILSREEKLHSLTEKVTISHSAGDWYIYNPHWKFDYPHSDKNVFTPNTDFREYITPHFQYGEVALWKEERRFETQKQCDNCLILLSFLEELREKFSNKQIVITSGYRPPEINKRLGGATNSEHLYQDNDGALDFYIKGENIFIVQGYVDKTWEHSVGYGGKNGFVHIGIGRGKRRWNY